MSPAGYTLTETPTHNPTPQLSSIGNTCFVDFSYTYPNASGDGMGDIKIDPQGEHRDSTTSAAGRPSFSGSAPSFHVHDGSYDESDDASPDSNRGRGNSIGDGYTDGFGLSRDAGGDGSDLGSKTKDERDGPTPPWMELKTKAGKERKRLPLACIGCRRKKIRCSGEKPACKHCLKSRIPCVYKVTTRKAAPRTDYMAMLDKRLKRMEERIIKIVPKDEHDPTAVTRAQVKPILPGMGQVRAVAGKKRMAEEAFGAELDTWVKSNPKGTNGEALPASVDTEEVEESRLLSEGADVVPSQEIQEHLAEVFFDNLYGQSYHLLHKPSFMRKLKAGTVPPVLILSVCAVSARFSTHPKLNSTPAFLRGETWAKGARDIITRRYDWPNLTILTCLLLLTLHEFGTCYGGRSWALGGMAIRMAYTLQLHKDLEYDPMNRTGKTKLSFIDREVRRRTMWACFLMDRFTSSGTNRPMFMKEETLPAQLPIKEKFFQLDIEGPTEDLRGQVPHPVASNAGQMSDARDNMGVAAYTIRAISMWGKIIIYLFQSGRESEKNPIWAPEAKFAELYKKAEGLIRNLPSFMKHTPENLGAHETEGLAGQFLFLHMSLQQNVLFLNHIAAHAGPSGRSPTKAPREFIARSTAKAFEAGKRISDVLKDAESHPVNAPFGGYCAFWSSSVQIPAAFSKSSTIEQTAKKNLATNVRYLSRMKRYWGAFHWTSEHLKEQFKACADAARQGSGDGTAISSFIYHYGDWFDRYPHGVSQSDFEDPESSIKKEKGDDAVLEDKSDYRTVEEFFNTLSPAPVQTQEQEVSKASRRRSSKKSGTSSNHPPKLDSYQQPSSTSNNHHNNPAQVAPPLEQMQNASGQQPRQQQHQMVAQVYDQLRSNSNASMYALQQQQQAYYDTDAAAAFQQPQHQAMLQFDPQLVFGAYAGGSDPLGMGMFGGMGGLAGVGAGNGGIFGGLGSGTHSLMYNPTWDIDMNHMSGFEEPTSAWFVPFGMEQGMGMGVGTGIEGEGEGVAEVDLDVFNSLGGVGAEVEFGGTGGGGGAGVLRGGRGEIDGLGNGGMEGVDGGGG